MPSIPASLIGSPSASSLRRGRRRRRLQYDRLLGDRLDLRPRVENRKVFTAGPQLEQVAVVSARRVARLTGVVERNRVVPVFEIGDELQGTAGRLIVGAAGRGHGVTVATARHRPDI